MAATPHDRLAALAEQVERTMRDLGAWSDPAPPLLSFNLPFAMDTMPFEHWLQLVLVPRMREIAAAREPLPASSGLAAHAVREFDGQDEMNPLVGVLRAIDDLCPAAPWQAGQPVVGARRLALGVALILLLTGWGVVAVTLTNRLAPALTVASPMVLQTFAGSVAPGDDFQPLRITVTALAEDEHAIRPSDASFTLLRSMRTMTRGPTAPFDFTMSERPTEAAVLDWLADHGVDEHAAPAHAAAAE
ncbi:MAG: YqcC family protein, partial [Candidatus Binatia bacterium]